MMNRFLCFRPFCKKGDVDSEKAESPAFVVDQDTPFGDLGFQKLALTESPDSYRRTDLWCDKVTNIPATELWCDEPTFTGKPVSRPRPPARYKSPAAQPTLPARHKSPAADWARKDADKRKDNGAEATIVPAEKKARTEPSSYAVALPESESD